MPPRKAKAKPAAKPSSKEDKEYKAKREKNNIAVKKSREQSRTKMKETVEQVQNLRDENTQLEKKCDILAQELKMLKDLFLVHAQSKISGSDEQSTSCDDKPTSSSAKRKASESTADVNINALNMDHEYSTMAKRKR